MPELATYEAAAQRYRERAAPPGGDLVSFLDRLVELVGIGDVLELGSGPGRGRHLSRGSRAAGDAYGRRAGLRRNDAAGRPPGPGGAGGVCDRGVLAFTVKEGDGEGWSEAKLDLPRFFTYWREPAARTALECAGWAVLSIDHVAGRHEPWLYVLARTA